MRYIYTNRENAFTLVEFLAVLGVLSLLVVLFIPAPRRHGFLELTSTDASGAAWPYTLFVPADYPRASPYPLIVFLHGAGDAYRVAGVGLGPAIRKRQASFPFLVLFPRIANSWTEDTEETQRALDLLAQLEGQYQVDPHRIYLTGVSDGGTGTWYWAAKHPSKWAALVPVSAAGQPELAPLISHIPCWSFQGAADRPVFVERGRAMIAALEAAGGHPRYTELAEHDHNVWDRAYRMPDLYDWLVRQRRPLAAAKTATISTVHR